MQNEHERTRGKPKVLKENIVRIPPNRTADESPWQAQEETRKAELRHPTEAPGHAPKTKRSNSSPRPDERYGDNEINDELLTSARATSSQPPTQKRNKTHKTRR